MGHIKEPDGIDLLINGKPLTKEEEIAISNFIKTYKTKHSNKKKAKRKKSSGGAMARR